MLLNAQIVNIPDANFKAKLLSSPAEPVAALDINGNPMIVDVNGDSQIQVSEALQVYTIHVGNSNISSLEGIASFTNLKELVAGNNNLTSFDATALSNIELLAISFNPLTSINVTGLNKLEALYIGYNQLTSLTILNLSKLKYLHCNSNPMTSLSVSGLPLLHELKCEDSQLVTLEVSDLPEIYQLNCSNNQLATLNLENISDLSWLRASGNPFTNVDLSMLENLTAIELCYTQLTKVDLSNNHVINQTTINHNDLLESINMKNGSNSNTYYLWSNPNMKYLCIDEEERIAVQESLDFYNITGVEINSYCSFTPGGDYNTISGIVSFDGDENGCDTSDALMPYVKVNIDNGSGDDGSSFSMNTGKYDFYTQSGNFTLTPQLNSWFTVTPASAVINLAEVDNSTTMQNFCVTANGIHPDLEVLIAPIGGARPGFDSDYKIIYKNKGNQVLSGQITFTYNDDVLDISGTPSETSVATGSLTWDYNGLQPFESRELFVTFKVNSPMETPPVNLDDVLTFTASITPTSGDETPEDNTFELNQIVVGSFDPNDITCLEGKTVNPEKIGEYLHYNINFENTGTAPATFIVVKDVIDETQFDVSSLQVIDASHNVEARVTGNKVEFIFDDINLAGNGKGNVVFKIKTLNSLAVNDDVTQKANIYFDYNWPIETNDATTVFGVLSRDSFQKDASVKLYPNPAVSIINLTAASEIKSVQLFDAQGRILETMVSGNENSVLLDVTNRASGLYFIKVITEQGSKVEKFVKK
jgi:uncharacterized repeat protein (TIGR01451 family)